jgi:hypothetical protein
MSVVLNFNYLVVRKAAIESLYPNGMAGFRKEWIPQSIGQEAEEDTHLLSFISMGGFLEPLKKHLAECGIMPASGNAGPNAFAGTVAHGDSGGCDWLAFDKEDDFLVCWLKDKERGPLAYAYLR